MFKNWRELLEQLVLVYSLFNLWFNLTLYNKTYCKTNNYVENGTQKEFAMW